MSDNDTGYINYIPYDADLKILARQNRKKATEAEQKIWDEVLRDKQFEGLKFHRQKPIGNYIADFYCPKIKLVIEVDGVYHSNSEIKRYDENRTIALGQYGIKVIRCTNEQVLNDIDGVKVSLLEEIKTKKKIPTFKGASGKSSIL